MYSLVHNAGEIPISHLRNLPKSSSFRHNHHKLLPCQSKSSFLSQQTVDTPLPAIAPLVYPIRYSQITTNSAGYLASCQSVFALAPPTISSVFTRPAYGGTCHTLVSTVLVKARDNASPTAKSRRAAHSEGAQAYALPIEGFAAVVPVRLGISGRIC